MSIILDADRHTGILETYEKDINTGQVRVKKTQDVEGIFKLNQREKNDNSNGWRGEFHKVASIPLVIVDQWREELKAQGASNPDPLAKENKMFLIAKLNNSDFSKLRTKEGRL